MSIVGGPPVDETSSGRPLLVLLAGRDEARRRVRGDVVAAVADVADLVEAPTVADALGQLDPARDLALTVFVVADEVVDDALDHLDDDPRARTASTLVVTGRDQHDDLGRSIDRDLVQAVVSADTPPGVLADELRSHLARWLRQHRGDADPRLGRLDTAGRPLELPDSELLVDLELDEDAITERLVAALDRALGRRPRLRLPAGTRLTHQGVGVDGVVVVLEGSVALDRSTSLGEIRLHHASTGPVVGILALAQQSRAFFTARATTDVEVVHLSLEQLDRALQREPEVGAAMAAVTVRALAQRLRRAEQLQLQKRQLNRDLDDERRHLRDTLDELEATRMELVESARFATLGELSAGLAHELNNPLAALTRAVAHVAEDVEQLLHGHPGGDAIRTVLHAGHRQPPRSSAQERAARRRLQGVLADPRLAAPLVTVGVDDPDEAQDLIARIGDTTLLEAAASLGTAIRNVEVASERISGLVRSLRAYARPTADPVDDVDVRATVDDALVLVSHRLGSVSVERDYLDVPPLRCHPAQLGQVWTNLLVNAAEAPDVSTITVRTERLGTDRIAVTVGDDGAGVPPEVLERLFEPRFTTKQGTVRYGLGMGLAISARIVESHGGTIAVDSTPGRTRVRVDLPVAGPTDDLQGADRRTPGIGSSETSP